MGVLNPQLREPGATPGEAKHWSLVAVCKAERIAAFGPAPHSPHEGFEGWWTFVGAFAAGALVLAFFDAVPKGYESFAGWATGVLLEALPAPLAEACSFAGDEVEHFEHGPWVASWAEASSSPAPLEDFESWVAPTSPLWGSAAFAPGGVAVEAFESTWPPLKAM